MVNAYIEGKFFEGITFPTLEIIKGEYENCHFTNCKFLNSNLSEFNFIEKADFQTAYNYSIDPDINRIRKAKFSMAGIIGLLDKHDIEIK